MNTAEMIAVVRLRIRFLDSKLAAAARRHQHMSALERERMALIQLCDNAEEILRVYGEIL